MSGSAVSPVEVLYSHGKQALSMFADYVVPAKAVVVETEIKKSRFITYLAPAASRAEALTYIASIRQQYPDASHHCTAFIAGPPDGGAAVAFDDDGEPSGTAGKPMLNVLQHKQIGEIVAVVVRYFGGTKLGAGGLVRAYSAAVQAACEELPLITRVALKEAVLKCDYAQEQKVRHHLGQHNIQLQACQYTEQVIMTITAPAPDCAKLADSLSEASRGQIIINWQD